MRHAALTLIVFFAVGCNAFRPSQTLNLTPNPIQVAALGYSSVAFASYTGDAMVTGHITALGGRGNDIVAYVLADDDFTNWLNGHQFRAYFSSGKITAATLHVGPLPAGSYHLVFDNRFSLLAKKTVAGTVLERFTK